MKKLSVKREDYIRVLGKPSACPVCGSKNIATYRYGFPRFSKALGKEIEQGRTILGGCCITEDDPVFKCMDCRIDFYREKL